MNWLDILAIQIPIIVLMSWGYMRLAKKLEHLEKKIDGILFKIDLHEEK